MSGDDDYDVRLDQFRKTLILTVELLDRLCVMPRTRGYDNAMNKFNEGSERNSRRRRNENRTQ